MLFSMISCAATVESSCRKKKWRKFCKFILQRMLCVHSYLDLTARSKVESIDARAQMCSIGFQTVYGKHAYTFSTRLTYYARQMPDISARLNCKQQQKYEEKENTQLINEWIYVWNERRIECMQRECIECSRST